MGFFNKFGDMMKLGDDDTAVENEYEEEYEEYEDDYEDDREMRSLSQYSSSKTSYDSKNNVVNFQANVQLGMVIIHPENYDDARTIADHIKSFRPVIINLDEVDSVLAQRIMDFVSGTCYTLHGDLQRVARNIFIIAPENVEISGDVRDELLKTKGLNLPWAKKDE